MLSLVHAISLGLIQIWPIVASSSIWMAEEPPPTSSAKVPDGFSAEVIATEPQIQDAVAFWIDPDGRLLVAETERTNHGAMDNRSSPWQLEDDLQSLTVEDRIAFMEKWKDKRATLEAKHSSRQ